MYFGDSLLNWKLAQSIDPVLPHVCSIHIEFAFRQLCTSLKFQIFLEVFMRFQ